MKSPRNPKGPCLVAEQDSVDSGVQRGGSSFCSVLLHLFDGEPRLSSSVQVDLVSTLGGLSLPDVTGDVEGDDNGSGQVGLWEIAATLENGRQVMMKGDSRKKAMARFPGSGSAPPTGQTAT